jgi:hypothetical protein
MTGSGKTPPTTPPPAARRWSREGAKARFSELVRRMRSAGPQHVAAHEREADVVIGADAFRRLKGERTGDAIVAAMQASPCRDIDIEPGLGEMPVRHVEF